MSDSAFVDTIVHAINLNLDVPLLDEAQEAAWIRYVVVEVDKYLPKWVRDLISSVEIADGLSASELDRIGEFLVVVLNRHINIPGALFTEGVEEMLIRPVVEAIIEKTKDLIA